MVILVAIKVALVGCLRSLCLSSPFVRATVVQDKRLRHYRAVMGSTMQYLGAIFGQRLASKTKPLQLRHDVFYFCIYISHDEG